MVSRIILAVILLLSVACSKQEVTKASLVVTNSFAVANMPGGLMIYIHSKDKKKVSATYVQSTTHLVNLENGEYDFRVVGWSGNTPMNGGLLCGKASAILSGGDATVDISMTNANCADSVFTPGNHKSGAGINTLRLVNCKNLVPVVAPGTICDSAARGNTGSYRFRLMSYKNTDYTGLPTLSDEGITGPCIPSIAAPSSVTAPGLSLPYGSPEERFFIVAESYTDTNCTSGKESYLFNRGLAFDSTVPGKTITFANGTNTDVYLAHGGVALTGSAFANTVIGNSNDQTFTLTNNSNYSISGISSSISAPFSFKGGSYPGTGGSCSASLAPGTNCTMVLTFTPGSPGSASQSFTVLFTENGASKEVKLNVSGQGLNPALITISDGPSYSFGDVLDTSSPNKIFTVTNTGQVAATGVNITPPGPPFTSSSNCGVTLAAGNNCTVTVNLNHSTYGSINDSFTVNYNNGVINTSSAITFEAWGIMTGLVEALYDPAGANWNDYIENDSPSSLFTDAGNACVPGSHSSCHHGGELRKVTLPDPIFSSCTGLVGQDDLNAFEWECTGGSPVVFKSRGLRKGKGLKDLVQGPNSWKPNTFKVTIGGDVVFQTTNPTWWGNTIYSLNGLSGTTSSGLPMTMPGVRGKSATNTETGTLRTFELFDPGAIYLATTNVTVPGFNITGDKIALVTAGSGKITGNNIGGRNCLLADGSISGFLNTEEYVLVCTGKDHVWIEVNAQNAASSVTTSVLMAASRFSRIHGTSLYEGGKGIWINAATKPNMVSETSVAKNTITGLTLTGSQKQTVVATKVMRGGNPAVKINSSTNNIFHDLSVGMGTYMGIRVESSSNDNTFTNLTITGHDMEGFDQNNSSGTTIINATIANNTKNFRLWSASNNTVIGLVTANASTGPGILLTSSSANNTFENVISSHNPINISIASSNNNSFTAVGSGDAATSDCNETGSSGNTIDLVSFSTGPCTNSVYTELTTAFLNTASSDATNLHSGSVLNGMTAGAITDFVKFDNPFRSWGRNATEMTNSAAGNCLSGACKVWDWRVQQNDVLENPSNTTFTPGAACPGFVDGSVAANITTDQQAAPNTFLSYAFEAIDGIGDDDGLCESNETCILSPNVGSFQGEGAIQDECIFSNGTVSGVTMRAFTTFHGN